MRFCQCTLYKRLLFYELICDEINKYQSIVWIVALMNPMQVKLNELDHKFCASFTVLSLSRLLLMFPVFYDLYLKMLVYLIRSLGCYYASLHWAINKIRNSKSGSDRRNEQQIKLISKMLYNITRFVLGGCSFRKGFGVRLSTLSLPQSVYL